MSWIETPEFWSAFAFCLVIFVVERPLSRALRVWGKKKATLIQTQIDEAQALADKAEQLVCQYRTDYNRRQSEKNRLMKEAEKEIQFLETEAMEQSHDQILRKRQEVEMRLKIIAENGRQDIKRKMLTHVVQKTKKSLADGGNTQKTSEDMEAWTNRLCEALDSYQTVLK